MNIVILDDYQDAVRKLSCFSKLDAYKTQTYTNNVKGVGQLAVRLRDAEVVVLIKERTALSRQLIEKLPKLKPVVLTGPHNQTVDVPACTERGIAVATGNYDPSTTAELTWALLMAASRRIPQYVASLRQGAWQQSGLKSAAMPANFGILATANHCMPRRCNTVLQSPSHDTALRCGPLRATTVRYWPRMCRLPVPPSMAGHTSFWCAPLLPHWPASPRC